MPPCVMRETIEELLAQAKAALVKADGEQAEALRDLVTQCRRTLGKAKRHPGFPGGRLETPDANVAFAAADRVRKQFPDLVPD